MFVSIGAKLLLGVAVLLAIVGVIFTIYSKGETAGASGEVAKVVTRTKQVQGKIDNAEQAVPRDPADISKLLRSGSF